MSIHAIKGHYQIFLLRLLGEYTELFNLGEVRGSRTAVVLAEDQTYEPDILFVDRERLHIIEKRGVFGPPDLVMEILSASTVAHDRGAKFHTYDRAGVRELWLIDPYGPTGTEFYQRRQANRLHPSCPTPQTRFTPWPCPVSSSTPPGSGPPRSSFPFALP